MPLTDEERRGQDAAEADALSALLQSDGWKVFKTLIDDEWGADATLLRIRKSLEGVSAGEQLAVDDLTQRVLSGQAAVRGMLNVPEQRLHSLKAKLQKPARVADRLRRGFR